MRQVVNVYCDESCHLEHDHQPVMVLGAVWCTLEATYEAARRIKDIKQSHGIASDFEAKWTKVSPGKLAFYQHMLDYFFDDDDLHCRVLVANKSNLNHARHNQDHDTWYYKMYFTMLQTVIDPTAEHRIYLDIKDTRGAEKVRKLHEVLCSSRHDFQRNIIARVQTVRSHEVALLQLTDLLIGAVLCANRGITETTSPAKRALVERVRQRSGYSLTRTTLLRERKLNLLMWEPSEGSNSESI